METKEKKEKDKIDRENQLALRVWATIASYVERKQKGEENKV